MHVSITEEVLRGQGQVHLRAVSVVKQLPVCCVVELTLPKFVYGQMGISGLIEKHGGGSVFEPIFKDEDGVQMPTLYVPYRFRDSTGELFSADDSYYYELAATGAARKARDMYREFIERGLEPAMAQHLILPNTLMGVCSYQHDLPCWEDGDSAADYPDAIDYYGRHEYAEYVRAIRRAVWKALAQANQGKE
jgi:hypothetical protein